MGGAAVAALPEDLAEAVSAYDAANLAWGRYWRYVLRPAAQAPDAGAVRAAFGEAALAAPQSDQPEEVLAFFDALATAFQALEALLARLPEELRTGDVLVAPAALREAIAALGPWVAGEGAGERRG